MTKSKSLKKWKTWIEEIVGKINHKSNLLIRELKWNEDTLRISYDIIEMPRSQKKSMLQLIRNDEELPSFVYPVWYKQENHWFLGLTVEEMDVDYFFKKSKDEDDDEEEGEPGYEKAGTEQKIPETIKRELEEIIDETIEKEEVFDEFEIRDELEFVKDTVLALFYDQKIPVELKLGEVTKGIWIIEFTDYEAEIRFSIDDTKDFVGDEAKIYLEYEVRRFIKHLTEFPLEKLTLPKEISFRFIGDFFRKEWGRRGRKLRELEENFSSGESSESES